MSLDCELLELDRLGLFPRCGESEAEYADRGSWTVLHPEMEENNYGLDLLLKGIDWKESEAVGQEYIEDALAGLERDFSCRPGWIQVFLSEPNHWHLINDAEGFTMVHKGSLHDTLKRRHPPFVVLNRKSLVPQVALARHEMIHAMRVLSDICAEEKAKYVGDYEECVADMASNELAIAIHSFLMLRQGGWLRYMAVEEITRAEFGAMAKYVILRTSYYEMAKTCLGEELRMDSVRNYICKTAEAKEKNTPYLRCEIMKEKLGL